MEKNKIGLHIIPVCPVLACCRLTTAIIKGNTSCQGAFLYPVLFGFQELTFPQVKGFQQLLALASPRERCQMHWLYYDVLIT